jgi:carboxymethylenebutenolidase
MAEYVTLTAADGHAFKAWRVDAEGVSKGAVVVVQEIFGVNSHIRNLCARFAAAGYTAIAPALFDRFERDFESGYSAEEVERARGFIAKPDWGGWMADIAAARDAVSDVGPVAVVGFCLGGSLAYMAALSLPIAAAVAYYGGRVPALADEAPKCPVQGHFGDQDAGIPVASVEAIRVKRPEIDLHIYPAGHGFGCDERAAFAPHPAAMAWSRTLAFLDRSLARRG